MVPLEILDGQKGHFVRDLPRPLGPVRVLSKLQRLPDLLGGFVGRLISGHIQQTCIGWNKWEPPPSFKLRSPGPVDFFFLSFPPFLVRSGQVRARPEKNFQRAMQKRLGRVEKRRRKNERAEKILDRTADADDLALLKKKKNRGLERLDG